MAKGYFKWKNRTNSLTYNSWKSMRNRCLYNNINSKRYKQRGIEICDRWLNNYDNFIEDMGERPSKEYTLDRIDPDGDYTLENCRWATWYEQENNKYGLTQIEYNGETHTIGEWCKILDLNDKQRSTAYKRYSKYNAKTFEEIFTNKHLSTFKKENRKNKCLICGSDNSCKWRKYGKLCNTCYHKALRWSKKEKKSIEEYNEWKKIKWN